MRKNEESRKAATPDRMPKAAAYAAATVCRSSRAPRFFTFDSWGSRPRLYHVAPSALDGLRPVFFEKGLTPQARSCRRFAASHRRLAGLSFPDSSAYKGPEMLRMTIWSGSALR